MNWIVNADLPTPVVRPSTKKIENGRKKQAVGSFLFLRL